VINLLRFLALLVFSLLLLGTGLCSAWGLIASVGTFGEQRALEGASLFLGLSLIGLAFCWLFWMIIRALYRGLRNDKAPPL